MSTFIIIEVDYEYDTVLSVTQIEVSSYDDALLKLLQQRIDNDYYDCNCADHYNAAELCTEYSIDNTQEQTQRVVKYSNDAECITIYQAV